MESVSASAPIRICDLGGWTDTWFAKSGFVLNIAVEPGIQVTWKFTEGKDGPDSDIARAALSICGAQWNDIEIVSSVPPGASTGTSAALAVACIKGLRPDLSPTEVANMAWRIETEILGRQSGLQDQICSAFGGIQFITIDSYPSWTTKAFQFDDRSRENLESRLLLVLLGSGHDSSALHRQVIAKLESTAGDQSLDLLRRCAKFGREALECSDLPAFGEAMIQNHECQARLHPDLVSRKACDIIELAKRHWLLGWKVNGAGGEGGSLTLLFNDPTGRAEFAATRQPDETLYVRISELNSSESN